MRTILLLLGVVLVAGHRAGADEDRRVDVPIQLDHAVVQQALVDQIYGGQPGTTVLWDDGKGCAFVKLWDPVVSSAGERVRIVSRGEARLGTALGSICVSPLTWDGYIELRETPHVDPGGDAVTFTITDSQVYDLEWKKPLLTGRLWDFVKDRVHPIRGSAHRRGRAAAGPPRAAAALDCGAGHQRRATHVGVGAPEQRDGHRRGAACHDRPAGRPPCHGQPAAGRADAVTGGVAALGEHGPTMGRLPDLPRHGPRPRQSIARLSRRVGHDADRGSVRHRRDARAVGAGGIRSDAGTVPENLGAPRTDPATRRSKPARRRRAAVSELHHGRGRAGGPATAWAWDWGRDLRRRIAPPRTDRRADRSRRPPRLLDGRRSGLAGLARLRRAVATADIPSDAEEPQTRWWEWWRERPALAADAPPQETVAGWMPSSERIDDYLRAVRGVLDEAATATLGRRPLDAAYVDLYRRIVLATAWQESCWRQFIQSAGRPTYLRSPVGAVGMMQVNERVWRGLYDLRGLRWDIRYNARAGTEILAHYLRDYAIAPRDRRLRDGSRLPEMPKAASCG